MERKRAGRGRRSIVRETRAGRGRRERDMEEGRWTRKKGDGAGRK